MKRRVPVLKFRSLFLGKRHVSRFNWERSGYSRSHPIRIRNRESGCGKRDNRSLDGSPRRCQSSSYRICFSALRIAEINGNVRRNFLKSCGQKLEGKNFTSKGLNMHGFAISRNREGGKFDGV